jgi:hypothetical protein
VARDFRTEVRSILSAYLAGEMSLVALLEWEGSIALEPEVPAEVRSLTDEVALLGSDVIDGLRAEAELITRIRTGLSAPSLAAVARRA